MPPPIENKALKTVYGDHHDPIPKKTSLFLRPSFFCWGGGGVVALKMGALRFPMITHGSQRWVDPNARGLQQLRFAMIRVDNQGILIVWHGVLEVVISLNLPRSSVNVTWRAKNQCDSCCGGEKHPGK